MIIPILHSQRLRVLMYHKLSENDKDGLTVTVNQFKEHLNYLKNNGFEIISIQTLQNHIAQKTKITAKKPVLITFDDGYVNNLTYLFPIVKEQKLPVTVFLPTSYIGKYNAWDEGLAPIMNWDEIASAPNEITFGLHSFTHKNFANLSDVEIIDEVKSNLKSFEGKQLNFTPSIAYPYGKFPKKRTKQLEQILKDLGVEFAFRIGNRHNPLPIKSPYFIQRLDITGNDTMDSFKKKLQWGKWF